MTAQRILYSALLFALLCPVAAYSASAKAPASAPAGASASIKPFLGRWDMTLKAPDREYPSWLEIRQEGDEVKARMVGRWGHARLLPKIEIHDTEITFVSPKEEEDRPDDMVFKGKLVGKTLEGTTTGPNGTPWPWTGRRAPTLKRTATPSWGQAVTLFNGKDFTGWRFSDPQKAARWKVEDGTLVSTGNGPEIITVPKFEDFKLHIEFNCAVNSNSGVYLRGRYEVQIENGGVGEPPNRRTGAVYGFLAASPEQPPKPGEWQSYDITLIGRTLTVVQNGQTIINNQEIPGITGGALDSQEELPGPLYLQGSEEGRVAFRNIVITPAKK